MSEELNDFPGDLPELTDDLLESSAELHTLLFRKSKGNQMTVRPVEEMRLRAFEMREAVKESPDADSERHLISQITIWEACAEICERHEVLSERLETSP